MGVKRAVTFLLIILLILQVLNFIFTKSLTFDEPNHIIRGYVPWINGNFKLNWAQPPLINLFSGFPLIFLSLEVPKDALTSHYVDIYKVSREFVDYNKNKLNLICILSRIPILILSILLALLVFQWANELFGYWAGVTALFLYSFNPSILAFSGLTTTDLGVTLFIFLTIYSLYKYLKAPTGLNLVILGIAFGLAFVSKFTSFLLVPIIFAESIVYSLFVKKTLRMSIIRSLKILFVIGCIGIIIVLLTYGLKIESAKLETANLGEGKISLIAKPYISGLVYVYQLPSEKRDGFLLGEFGHYWWHAFIVSFLVKTPLPLIIILFLSSVFFKKRENMIFLLLPALIFFGGASLFPVPAALRYILPIYPLLIVSAGSIVQSLIFSKKAPRFFCYSLFVWYLLGTLNISPHYLAYFNELAGGPQNGHKILGDSNLDIGQDLKLLKNYIDKNDIDEIHLAYFGTVNPSYYGIPYRKLEPFTPTQGWVAVSATYLQGLHTQRKAYSWLKKFKPVARIGYSIFIYKIK